MVENAYLAQDAFLWIPVADRRVVWTAGLNECMVFIIFTDTHHGFYHLSSHNYLLNPNAPKGIAPGNHLVDQSTNRVFNSVRIYSNPPDNKTITRGMVNQVRRNFTLPEDTQFFAINEGANKTLAYDTGTGNFNFSNGISSPNGIANGFQHRFLPLTPAGGTNSCCIVM